MTTQSTPEQLAAVPRLASGLSWQQQPVGFAFRTFARTITETDLSAFVALTGFVGPLFLDARKAPAAGYAGRLVPGMLTLTFAEGLVLQTNVMNGTGLGFLAMTFEVHKPCFVGSTIEVVVEVTESRASSKANRGVVTSRNSVLNEHGELVLTYCPVRLQRGSQDQS